jgi:4-hydroxybenzoate polyprenyltransferase
MKIFSILTTMITLPFLSAFPPIISPVQQATMQLRLRLHTVYPLSPGYPFIMALPSPPLSEKVSAFFELARIKKNVIPTTGLVIASISSNDVIKKIQLQTFMTSFAMVHILCAMSMIVNDIWDIKSDRINHPERPLVRGILSMREARMTVVFSSILYFGLGCRLPPSLIPYWLFPWIVVHLYTPLLKRICLVKNISCASVIASTVSFVGKSAYSVHPLHNQLYDLTHMVFIWSVFVEVLLDVLDAKGDELDGIPTVPVIFGNENTMAGLFGVLFVSQMRLYQLSSHVFAMLHFAFYAYMIRIIRSQYGRTEIRSACKQMTYLLLFFGVVRNTLV